MAIGVLHHIEDDNDFKKALKNIRAMAKKRIILGVKLGDKPNIIFAKQRPLKVYIEFFGQPTLVVDANYLTILVFDVS